jgi:hypothetical protein
VLTQNDIESEGRFDDLIAYGGWSMDDHHPTGFHSARLGHPATLFHPAPSPFGIPYRALYSRNVENLMFAGRCASCTHSAMSSTRVMGTGCSMGQAAGAAAAIAIAQGIAPGAVTDRVEELQQALLEDDCYLPWVPRKVSAMTRRARLEASQGDPEPVRDGITRPVGDNIHAWVCSPGDHIAYKLERPTRVREVVLALDSSLDMGICIQCKGPKLLTGVPPTMPKAFRVEVLEGGGWAPFARVDGNYQRHVRLSVGRKVGGIRLVMESTWGSPQTRLYHFEVR